VFHFVRAFLHRNAALRYPCALNYPERLEVAAGHSPETELNGVKTKMSRTRRDALALAAGIPVAASAANKSKLPNDLKKTVHYRNGKPATTPLYSEVISCGDFVFVSGHGTNKVGGIREQTEFVLNEIDACLKSAGTTMANAVKCNVYLAKLEDYKAMNEAYLGKFGAEPPVRTTVAVAGIPLEGALVEIEVIAQR
jgi:enamine deaminase RidA (YjgF/YER057c/UK114 family)